MIPNLIKNIMNTRERKTSNRILFLTTVRLTEHVGGVIYSRSLINALSTLGEVIVVPLSDFQYHTSRRTRWVSAGLKSFFTFTPPNVLFHSGILTEKVLKLLDQDWDLVAIDHLESSYLSSRIIRVPVIYFSHNRESVLIEQKLSQAPRWIKKLLSAWVDHYERQIVASVDAVVTISSQEAHWYRSLNRAVSVVPPVFDTKGIHTVHHSSQDRLRVGFLGGADWPPNREAVELLITHILPLTKRQIDFFIAGKNWSASELQRKLENANANTLVKVSCLGYINDVSTFWSSIDVFAAPISAGAGVNVKVCEALANARPVIALPYALRGLDGIAQDLILKTSSINEFADAINSFDPRSYLFSPPYKLTPAYAADTLAKFLAPFLKRIKS